MNSMTALPILLEYKMESIHMAKVREQHAFLLAWQGFPGGQPTLSKEYIHSLNLGKS